jgi:predicted transcriptional regulator of viral defense system
MNDLLAWAGERPLFTVNDAERASGIQRASLLEKLSRLAGRGELVENGN